MGDEVAHHRHAQPELACLAVVRGFADEIRMQKPDSKWSTINRRRYADLKARGLLAAPGLSEHLRAEAAMRHGRLGW